MTDRELLEYAAKAAGIPGAYDEDMQAIQTATKLTPYGEVHSYWDALHDDAEAFRLAVKLGIDIDFDELEPRVEAYRKDLDAPRVFCADECLEPDPLAATRRAILLAAAWIGAQP